MKHGLIFPVIYDTDFSTFFITGTIRDLQVVFSHITAGRFPVWLIVIKVFILTNIGLISTTLSGVDQLRKIKSKGWAKMHSGGWT